MHYWNEAQQQSEDELVTKRPSTQRDMKWTMSNVWLPRFGARNMDSLKTAELQKFLASLIGAKEEGKISRQTALKYKTYLSSVFSAAIRLECGVTYNPVYDHRQFSGFVVPTRRRVHPRKPDGRPRRHPVLIWIDVDNVVPIGTADAPSS